LRGAFLALALSVGALAAPFSFTVTADARGNAATFDTVLAAIQNRAGGLGAFHISCGDVDPPGALHAKIAARFGTGARWYAGIGNHEAEKKTNMRWLREQYRAGHRDQVALQQLPHRDGPPGCVETTYSWDCGNAHFVMLNEYWNGTAAANSDSTGDGDITPALYDWLAADLTASNKPFKFVFGHEPAYPVRAHEHKSLDKHPTHRDAFWNLLENHNVTAYVCGHTHFFSRYQRPGGSVWQIDVGNAGNDPGDGKTFLNVVVGDTRVQFDIWRDGGTDTFTLAKSWTVPEMPAIGR
jgi:hypothetical protein